MTGSQDSRTTGLTQGMAYCSMHEGPPGLATAKASNVCTEGWKEWTEETIKADFEFIKALRAQDSDPFADLSRPEQT